MLWEFRRWCALVLDLCCRNCEGLEILERMSWNLGQEIFDREMSKTSGLLAPKWVVSAGPRTSYFFLSEWINRMRPLRLVILEIQVGCLAFRSPSSIILLLQEFWKILSKSEARRGLEGKLYAEINWNLELSLKVTPTATFSRFSVKKLFMYLWSIAIFISMATAPFLSLSLAVTFEIWNRERILRF